MVSLPTRASLGHNELKKVIDAQLVSCDLSIHNYNCWSKVRFDRCTTHVLGLVSGQIRHRGKRPPRFLEYDVTNVRFDNFRHFCCLLISNICSESNSVLSRYTYQLGLAEFTPIFMLFYGHTCKVIICCCCFCNWYRNLQWFYIRQHCFPQFDVNFSLMVNIRIFAHVQKGKSIPSGQNAHHCLAQKAPQFCQLDSCHKHAIIVTTDTYNSIYMTDMEM